MKVASELAKVWEAVPDELKTSDEYCFVVSKDWEEVPSEYEGKEVFQARLLKEGNICYMFNPFMKE